jgi:hypothetical protein
MGEYEDGFSHNGTSSISLVYGLGSHATIKATEHLPLCSEGRQEKSDLNERWWDWVGDYMERNLTHPSDQYAAFARVTKLHQEITSDEPVLGMWKEHLPMHLTWGASALGDTKKTTNRITLTSARYPSWTWMTYPHGSAEILYPYFNWTVLKTDRHREIYVVKYRLGYVAEILT